MTLDKKLKQMDKGKSFKDSVIFKKIFWQTFFKSLGCLGMLLGGFAIASLVNFDWASILVIFLGFMYYFMGFWGCYDKFNRK
jgi:Ca2+-dependent lipid-binding protein